MRLQENIPEYRIIWMTRRWEYKTSYNIKHRCQYDQFGSTNSARWIYIQLLIFALIYFTSLEGNQATGRCMNTLNYNAHKTNTRCKNLSKKDNFHTDNSQVKYIKSSFKHIRHTNIPSSILRHHTFLSLQISDTGTDAKQKAKIFSHHIYNTVNSSFILYQSDPQSTFPPKRAVTPIIVTLTGTIQDC